MKIGLKLEINYRLKISKWWSWTPPLVARRKYLNPE